MEKSTETSLRIKVMLSTQRALLGAITSSLRAVTIQYDSSLFVLRAYYDTGASAEDKELINEAMTEITADLSQEIADYRYEPVDLPFPAKMEILKDWVYKRSENPDL